MRDLSLLMYLELDGLCLFLLLYIFVKSFRQFESRQSWRLYQSAIVLIMLFVTFDLIWKLMESHVLPNRPPLPYLVNSLYFLCSVFCSTTWFFFTESEMGTDVVRMRYLRLIAAFPAAMMLILLIISYFNGCMFFFDAQGAYVRGPLFLLSFLVPCLYLILSIIRPLSRAFRKENYAIRRNFLNLAWFSMITVIASILQILVPGSPLPCVGITLAIVLVFVNSQELLVSLDPLTKLRNRYHMVRYISSKMEHPQADLSLFLVMLDVDDFKRINDTFGHVEGDRALVRVADVLREASMVFNCFVGRYGGDEFVMVIETPRDEDITEICDFIQRQLDEESQRLKTGYQLRVSYGMAKWNQSLRYVPDFIALADEALYHMKRKRHSA